MLQMCARMRGWSRRARVSPFQFEGIDVFAACIAQNQGTVARTEAHPERVRIGARYCCPRDCKFAQGYDQFRLTSCHARAGNSLNCQPVDIRRVGGPARKATKEREQLRPLLRLKII